ncbi:hypothetical protein CEXT_185721 [Caerostris extrusa]|uniref:ATP synthase subunit a n=1 Tax=Caerostris extrusa TaxID=172846 RepID=A0AAV4VIE5_CAEEX|nr:hypothetical protein CEXT_185721 [Caerostris extrusa]
MKHQHAFTNTNNENRSKTLKQTLQLPGSFWSSSVLTIFSTFLDHFISSVSPSSMNTSFILSVLLGSLHPFCFLLHPTSKLLYCLSSLDLFIPSLSLHPTSKLYILSVLLGSLHPFCFPLLPTSTLLYFVCPPWTSSSVLLPFLHGGRFYIILILSVLLGPLISSVSPLSMTIIFILSVLIEPLHFFCSPSSMTTIFILFVLLKHSSTPLFSFLLLLV